MLLMYATDAEDGRTVRHEELHDSFPKKVESSFRMLRNESAGVTRYGTDLHIQAGVC